MNQIISFQVPKVAHAHTYEFTKFIATSKYRLLYIVCPILYTYFLYNSLPVASNYLATVSTVNWNAKHNFYDLLHKNTHNIQKLTHSFCHLYYTHLTHEQWTVNSEHTLNLEFIKWYSSKRTHCSLTYRLKKKWMEFIKRVKQKFIAIKNELRKIRGEHRWNTGMNWMKVCPCP